MLTYKPGVMPRAAIGVNNKGVGKCTYGNDNRDLFPSIGTIPITSTGKYCLISDIKALGKF